MLLQKYFETRLGKVEANLKHFVGTASGPAKELKKAMRYAVFSGGKRWRPLLLLAVYEMLAGAKKAKGFQDALNAATAVELIHNASIVHDDMPMVMNRSERRSSPALHLKFDNTIGILAGDALYTLAFEVLGYISNPQKALECLRILALAAQTYGMMGGQIVALESKRKVMKINVLRYIDMKKIGSLLQASTDMACVLADADDDTRQVMSTYAMNLGMAHQMIEDIVADYSRGSDELDFDSEYVPTSRNTYTGLLGFDKARAAVEKLLDDTNKMIAPYPHNDVLLEFVQMIKERMP